MTNEYIPSIFIAYSHKDKAFLDELKASLSPLLRKQKASIWSDGEIKPGDVWDYEINKQIHTADIILLLLSRQALSSNYFYEKELKDALLRHEKNEVKVIPILLTACFWKETPLKQLQVLPRSATPISEWPDQNTAWNDVTESINLVLDELAKQKTQEEKQRLEAAALQQKLKEEVEMLKRIEQEKQEKEARHLAFRADWENANNLMRTKNWKAAEPLLQMALSQWEPGFSPNKSTIITAISKCVSKRLSLSKSPNRIVIIANKLNLHKFFSNRSIPLYLFTTLLVGFISLIAFDKNKQLDLYKNAYPFVVKEIAFKNKLEKNKLIKISEFYCDEIEYLVPVLHYFSPENKSLNIYVKILNANRQVIRTSNSPKNYSFISPNIKLKKSSFLGANNEVNLYSFGFGESYNTFFPGYYRIEVWCNGLCIKYKFIKFKKSRNKRTDFPLVPPANL